MQNSATDSHGRDNNFGFLRLLFAAFVIVSHSPEMVDGNRSREILTLLFGTMSFGEVAVDGFFLISGFLVTQSFVSTPSLSGFLLKRTARIVPGYFACFWICALAIGPFVISADIPFSWTDIVLQFPLLIRMLPPNIPDNFMNLPCPALNTAIWTLAYEFRCYLVAALLGLLGFYRPKQKFFLLAVVLALLIANALGFGSYFNGYEIYWLGVPKDNVRFFAVFGAGALFYLFQDKIRLTDTGALLAAPLLIALLFSRLYAETAYVILGGYLIFWCALKMPVMRISRLDNRADISYGLYLYAWPIQNLIIWADRASDPWFVCGATLVCAGLLGYLSWHLIESPCLRFVHTYTDRKTLTPL